MTRITALTAALLLAGTCTAASAQQAEPVWRTQIHAETSQAIANQGNTALQSIREAAIQRLGESLPALRKLTPLAPNRDTEQDQRQ